MAHAYEDLCNHIIEHVGGRKNIADVYHCITRLRILVKDKGLVNFDKLKGNTDILQVKDIGNQVQCVIGMQVPEVYSDFCEITGIEEKEAVAADEDDSDLIKSDGGNDRPEQLDNPVTRFLNTIAAIMTPALAGMIAGGMLKSFLAIFSTFGLMDPAASEYQILNAIGDAPFYFLPFLVGFSSAKRFKIEPEYGIIVAGVLMYPTIMNAAADGTVFSFLGFGIQAINYKTAIFPVILSVWVFSLIYKFINKHMLVQIRIVFVGFLSLLIAGPIVLGVAAPLGQLITNVLIDFFTWMFNWNGWLAGGLFCGLIPVMIIFGIRGFGPVEMGNHARFGCDYLLPMFFYSNLAVSGAAIAASLKLGDPARRSSAISSGLLGILGVTEPALYGTIVPLKTPLIGACVGGALAGGLAMTLHVVQYAYVMPGITSIASYLDGTNNFLNLCIVMAVAWVSSFVISFVLTKKTGGEDLQTLGDDK